MIGAVASTLLASAMLGPGAAPSAVHPASGPTPPAGPASSTDPLSSIAGFGFAKTGDLIHAVPLFGPLATGVLEPFFCAVRDIPIVGSVASSAVSQFDNDQKQNGCPQSGTSQPKTGTGTSLKPTGSASAGGSATGSGTLPGLPSFSLPAMGSAPQITAPHVTAPHVTAPSTPALTVPSLPTVSLPNLSLPNASLPAASSAGAAASPAAVAPPEGTKPQKPAKAAKAPAKPAPHAPVIAAHFPDVPFTMREGRGHGLSCLLNDTTQTGVTLVPCAQGTVWTFQSSTKEVRLKSDPTLCLTAPAGNLQIAVVRRCDSVKPWQRQWLLSPGYRVYIADTDDHGSYRFLGAPGAPGSLVVGGTQAGISKVPTWGFQLS